MHDACTGGSPCDQCDHMAVTCILSMRSAQSFSLIFTALSTISVEN